MRYQCLAPSRWQRREPDALANLATNKFSRIDEQKVSATLKLCESILSYFFFLDKKTFSFLFKLDETPYAFHLVLINPQWWCGKWDVTGCSYSNLLDHLLISQIAA